MYSNYRKFILPLWSPAKIRFVFNQRFKARVVLAFGSTHPLKKVSRLNLVKVGGNLEPNSLVREGKDQVVNYCLKKVGELRRSILVKQGASTCSLPLWRVHEIKRMYLASRTHGLFIT